MIYIILLVVAIILLRFFFLGSQLTKSKVEEYAKNLDPIPSHQFAFIESTLSRISKQKYMCGRMMPNEIRDEDDFHFSFDLATEALFIADRMREPEIVNLLAWFIVKYYARYIIEYGNYSEKSVYLNNVKLLKFNGFL